MINNNRSLNSFLITFLLFFPISAFADPIVIFDQGHGQQFLAEHNGPLDLSEFANLFTNEGAEVISSNKTISPDVLSGVHALVISGPFLPFAETEIEAILEFIRQGGRLALMAHIGQPLARLIHELGGAISSAAVYEQENIIGENSRNFMVTDLQDHPLTRNLDAFAVYGTWALMAEKESVREIAKTSHDAWIDLNQNGELNKHDAKQVFALILAGSLGNGEFVIFGDDAIFQNRFLQGGNRILGQNLAQWFCLVRQSI